MAVCGRIVWQWDAKMQQWVKSWLDDEEAYAAAVAEPAVAQSRYNINPGATVPVARRVGDTPSLEMRKWAFPLDGRYVFNTRIETAFESPMWRQPMEDGRCVVPVTGFYEWRTHAGGKAPFYVHRRDGEPMLLAGVSGWRAHRGDETPCVSIVTCPPNDLMAKLHDRMPVVLEAVDVDAWLEPGATPHTLRSLAGPAGDVLDAHPVAARVGNQANDDPELIRPVPTLGDPLA